MLKIKSPSRLHLSLIDMNAEIGRIDGGIGLTLDYPNIILSAKKSDNIEIYGKTTFRDRIKTALESVLPSSSGVTITIKEEMAIHSGLGSGTQAALSAATAANTLYNLGLSVRDLAIITKRGGTSGIGVAAFENGGFIVDGGHKFSLKNSFSPSSASKAPPAPIIFRHDFPDWHILLAIPNLNGMHGLQEINIFKKECPIPLTEVQKICHIVLMQMLPSILEKDIESFGYAIETLQHTGFKKREMALQSQEVKELIYYIQNTDIQGVGLSSFGPTVFGFTDSKKYAEHIQKQIQAYLDESIGGTVILTKANNSGAYIWKD